MFQDLTINWSLVLLQLIHLLVLTSVMWFLLYRPVLSYIEKRRADIIKSVADAERVRVALKEAEVKRAEILTQAHLEAESIVHVVRPETQQLVPWERDVVAIEMVWDQKTEGADEERLPKA